MAPVNIEVESLAVESVVAKQLLIELGAIQDDKFPEIDTNQDMVLHYDWDVNDAKAALFFKVVGYKQQTIDDLQTHPEDVSLATLKRDLGDLRFDLSEGAGPVMSETRSLPPSFTNSSKMPFGMMMKDGSVVPKNDAGKYNLAQACASGVEWITKGYMKEGATNSAIDYSNQTGLENQYIITDDLQNRNAQISGAAGRNVYAKIKTPKDGTTEFRSQSGAAPEMFPDGSTYYVQTLGSRNLIDMFISASLAKELGAQGWQLNEIVSNEDEVLKEFENSCKEILDKYQGKMEDNHAGLILSLDEAKNNEAARSGLGSDIIRAVYGDSNKIMEASTPQNRSLLHDISEAAKVVYEPNDPIYGSNGPSSVLDRKGTKFRNGYLHDGDVYFSPDLRPNDTIESVMTFKSKYPPGALAPETTELAIESAGAGSDPAEISIRIVLHLSGELDNLRSNGIDGDQGAGDENLHYNAPHYIGLVVGDATSALHKARSNENKLEGDVTRLKKRLVEEETKLGDAKFLEVKANEEGAAAEREKTSAENFSFKKTQEYNVAVTLLASKKVDKEVMEADKNFDENNQKYKDLVNEIKALQDGSQESSVPYSKQAAEKAQKEAREARSALELAIRKALEAEQKRQLADAAVNATKEELAKKVKDESDAERERIMKEEYLYCKRLEQKRVESDMKLREAIKKEINKFKEALRIANQQISEIETGPKKSAQKDIDTVLSDLEGSGKAAPAVTDEATGDLIYDSKYAWNEEDVRKGLKSLWDEAQVRLLHANNQIKNIKDTAVNDCEVAIANLKYDHRLLFVKYYNPAGEFVGSMDDVDGKPWHKDVIKQLTVNGETVANDYDYPTFKGEVEPAQLVSDIDGDGIDNKLDPDNDNDGLSNEAEADVGTDPTVADTDGDGLTDGDEVLKYGTDPGLPDTDADGFTDGDEVNKYETNPNAFDADADGDGIPDTSTAPTV